MVELKLRFISDQSSDSMVDTNFLVIYTGKTYFTIKSIKKKGYTILVTFIRHSFTQLKNTSDFSVVSNKVGELVIHRKQFSYL